MINFFRKKAEPVQGVPVVPWVWLDRDEFMALKEVERQMLWLESRKPRIEWGHPTGVTLSRMDMGSVDGQSLTAAIRRAMALKGGA